MIASSRSGMLGLTSRRGRGAPSQTRRSTAIVLDYLNRVASRFLCATVWYDPYNPVQDARRPWLVWLNRFLLPVPFLALLVLLFISLHRPLREIEWVVVGVYVLYL